MAGFPLIDFKATLNDGAYHEVDSGARLRDRGRAAFREGMRKARPSCWSRS